jgi:hypothetical protein
VTISLERLTSEQSRAWGNYLDQQTPAEADPQWQFLGFDVCDSGFLSGLTNCGYLDSAELLAARRNWGTSLNEHHLFKDPEPAFEFKIYSDHRVQEHAPFFVFGLWVVEEIGADRPTPVTSTA